MCFVNNGLADKTNTEPGLAKSKRVNFFFETQCRAINQSHRLERVVPTGPITMFQLLIGLIQSRDNRGRHVLSSETIEVEGYENGRANASFP